MHLPKSTIFERLGPNQIEGCCKKVAKIETKIEESSFNGNPFAKISLKIALFRRIFGPFLKI